MAARPGSMPPSAPSGAVLPAGRRDPVLPAAASSPAAGPRPAVLAFVFSSALALLAGCATHPPALPPALPSQLPQAWLAPLREMPCPGPLRGNLRIRIRARGRPSTTIDGSLQAILPDTLRLSARFGAFRPVFALIATADSCELLLHGDALYWIVPRRDADWSEMTPAAWAEALHWALCPADLVRRFVPDERGGMRDGLYRVGGTVEGARFRLTLGIDPRAGGVRELRISERGRDRLEVRTTGERRAGSAWVPTELDLSVPDEEFALHAEILGLDRVSRSRIQRPEILRPPRWRAAHGEMVLPLLRQE